MSLHALQCQHPALCKDIISDGPVGLDIISDGRIGY